MGRKTLRPVNIGGVLAESGQVPMQGQFAKHTDEQYGAVKYMYNTYDSRPVTGSFGQIWLGLSRAKDTYKQYSMQRSNILKTQLEHMSHYSQLLLRNFYKVVESISNLSIYMMDLQYCQFRQRRYDFTGLNRAPRVLRRPHLSISTCQIKAWQKSESGLSLMGLSVLAVQIWDRL